MRFIHNILPITDWLPKYKKAHLTGDLFAGITVGVMLIPQGMAYALIAGLPPVYGLYASIVPQLIYALFGTSRQLSVGPVAMDSLLVAAGVSVIATSGTETYIALAILLAFLTGLFQVLLGIMRLGFITNLMSKPVISGFTSAAALVIAFNQLPHLLGVAPGSSDKPLMILFSLFGQFQEVYWMTLLIGIGSVLLILALKKVSAKIPGALLSVIMGTLLVSLFGLNEQGVSIVRAIPDGLPDFKIPVWSLDQVFDLLPLAITLSLISYMEAFSIAKALESKTRDHKVRPNQELIALGASNLLGSLFQGFSVTGGFSRSAVNQSAGANTPLASVISAVLIGLTLIFLTPLFYYLPNAVLAAVIIVGVLGLIDFGYAKQLWQDSKIEFALLAGTFLITLNFNLVVGIIGGIVFSILILLYKTANPHIARLGRVPGHHEFRNVRRFKNLEVWPHVLIIRLDAPLTFINIQYFKEYVESHIYEPDGKVETVILDAGPISYLDASASSGLRELLENLREKQVEFVICDLIGPVRDMLHKTGLGEILNKENVFFDLNEAVKYAVTHEQGDFKDFALQANDDK